MMQRTKPAIADPPPEPVVPLPADPDAHPFAIEFRSNPYRLAVGMPVADGFSIVAILTPTQTLRFIGDLARVSGLRNPLSETDPRNRKDTDHG